MGSGNPEATLSGRPSAPAIGRRLPIGRSGPDAVGKTFVATVLRQRQHEVAATRRLADRGGWLTEVLADRGAG
jgi:hypothetical protein